MHAHALSSSLVVRTHEIVAIVRARARMHSYACVYPRSLAGRALARAPTARFARRRLFRFVLFSFSFSVAGGRGRVADRRVGHGLGARRARRDASAQGSPAAAAAGAGWRRRLPSRRLARRRNARPLPLRSQEKRFFRAAALPQQSEVSQPCLFPLLPVLLASFLTLSSPPSGVACRHGCLLSLGSVACRHGCLLSLVSWFGCLLRAFVWFVSSAGAGAARR